MAGEDMDELAGTEWRREGESIVRDDIFVHGWNRVRLTLTTHSAGGLTDNDFQMARRIDGLEG